MSEHPTSSGQDTEPAADCRRCDHPAHDGRPCRVKRLVRPMVRVRCTCGGSTEPHPFVPGEQAWDSVEEVRWGPPLCAYDRCHQREEHTIHTPPTSGQDTAEHEIDTARMRACAPLLPPPGDEVVRDLCDALDRQQEETARLRAERDEAQEAYRGQALLARFDAEKIEEQRDDARGLAAALEAELAAVRRALDDELANLADDGARLSHSVVRRMEAILDRAVTDA